MSRVKLVKFYVLSTTAPPYYAKPTPPSKPSPRLCAISYRRQLRPVHTKQQGLDQEGMDAETAKLFPDSFEESELGLVPDGMESLNRVEDVGGKGGYGADLGSKYTKVFDFCKRQDIHL